MTVKAGRPPTPAQGWVWLLAPGPPGHSAMVGLTLHPSCHAMWQLHVQVATSSWLCVCPKDMRRHEHPGE